MPNIPKRTPKAVKEEKKVVRLKNPEYRVHVIGGGYDYIRLMYLLGFSGAKGFADADIILFTGGEDVDPALYGEMAMRGTFFNRSRDEREKFVYENAVQAGIPMVGICRGGQFLNVMNGGRMWQHVDGHTRDHPAFEIDIDGKVLREMVVTSTHHQMMIPADNAVTLMIAAQSSNLNSYGQEIQKAKPTMDDTEVVWYPDTKCLCFQPHPEMKNASSPLVNYFNSLLDNLIIPVVLENVSKQTKAAG